MKKLYVQTTCESCLAVAMLYLSKIKITKRKECDILFNALKHHKYSFIKGNIEYFKRKYKTNLKRKSIRKIKEIDKFIPAIINLDDFVLRRKIHYPHFIVVDRKVKNNYEIYDPWDGKIKVLSKKILNNGIKLLENRLNFKPMATYR